MFLNCQQMNRAIEEGCGHYEKSAPMVSDWLDELYRRLGDKQLQHSVMLSEILFVGRLQEAGEWIPANLAANELYHLRNLLGQEQTGILSY